MNQNHKCLKGRWPPMEEDLKKGWISQQPLSSGYCFHFFFFWLFSILTFEVIFLWKKLNCSLFLKTAIFYKIEIVILFQKQIKVASILKILRLSFIFLQVELKWNCIPKISFLGCLKCNRTWLGGVGFLPIIIPHVVLLCFVLWKK